ncbi:hypothetical protein [Phenylobacterium montanum]|uniref:Lipoprotein n=1 Tax=Phenylobacterium montanum TaxID=2823693 RepID=A0A975IWX6_9CAUL|nr:hypothetical protein [Caulobacter sp. S6]QUD90044.1 hypothetical protein KCG34_09355 [Caulobacter sp. S6]
MRFGFASAAALSSVLALGACATVTPQHVPIGAKAQAAIPSTEIVAPIKQSEIYVYVPPANANAGAGFGLVGVLVAVSVAATVDSVRQGHAEEAVKPLRNAILDFNFDDTFRAELKRSVSQVGWMHVDDARIMKDVLPANIDGAITGSKDGAVLIVVTDYHLSTDGAQLYVVTNAALYPNSDALKALQAGKAETGLKSDPANALYRNAFMYQARVPGASGDRNANIAGWSANGGEAMRKALKEAAVRIADLVQADLQDQETGKTGPAANDGSDGQIIANEEAGQLVRHGDGTLVYTAKSVH